MTNVKTAIEIAESEKAPDPYSHKWSAYSSSNFNNLTKSFNDKFLIIVAIIKVPLTNVPMSDH